MAIESFGQFLVNEGVLTAEQLSEAMADADPARLARLAVAKGILLPEEINKILELYGSDLRKLHQRAVKAGMMTQEQLDYLRRLQLGDSRGLAETVRRKGWLSEEQLNAQLTAFQSQQSAYQVAPLSLPEGMAGRVDAVTLINLTGQLLGELCALPAQPGTAEPWSGEYRELGFNVQIELGGDFAGSYILTVVPHVAKQIAVATMGVEPGQVTADDQREALWEFANGVVGAAAGALGARGQEMTFHPPTAFDPSAIPPGKQRGLRCRISTPAGIGDLLIT